MVCSKEEVLDFVEKNLTYNRGVGEFYWKESRGRVKAGALAGGLNGKYRQIRILGKWHKVHRLVWLLETGDWPQEQIDHIDRDPTNNKITNLRDTTNYINCLNRGRVSSSGVVGVTFDRVNKMWLAQTFIDGVAKNLGRYKTVEEAEAAYLGVNKSRLLDESSK